MRTALRFGRRSAAAVPPSFRLPIQRKLLPIPNIHSKSFCCLFRPTAPPLLDLHERHTNAPPPYYQQRLHVAGLRWRVLPQPPTVPQQPLLLFPPRAPFHASAALAAKKNLYDALGVSKSATKKEIKLAYFKVAKQYHPDTMREKPKPEQDRAKVKWQEAADAYEILSNDSKRAAYDASGYDDPFGFGSQQGQQGQQYSQQQQQQQQANAQQTWSTVTADADIIEEALREYAEEVQENFVAAASGVADGDLQPSWEFLKRHKGVVATVVLPAFLVFRFPGPVLAFIRFIPQIAGFVLAAVIYSSRVLGPRGSIALLRVVWTSLWPLLVSGMQTGVKDAALKAQAYTEKRRAAKTGPGGDDDGAGGSGGGGGGGAGGSGGRRTKAQEEAQRKADARRAGGGKGQQRRGRRSRNF
jgi:hypothetical protein